MSRFACVVLLPDTIEGQADFLSREFDTLDQIVDAMRELEARNLKWRVLSFCHIEDLPLLMADPKESE